MSIASTVLTVNDRLELARTLMKEKLTANGKEFLTDDNLIELIERWRCFYYDKCSVDCETPGTHPAVEYNKAEWLET